MLTSPSWVLPWKPFMCGRLGLMRNGSSAFLRPDLSLNQASAGCQAVDLLLQQISVRHRLVSRRLDSLVSGRGFPFPLLAGRSRITELIGLFTIIDLTTTLLAAVPYQAEDVGTFILLAMDNDA